MTTIHLIRHGDVHNPRKILYGRLPRFRLSEQGRQQAEAAAAYLQDRPLAAIISSPRLRARQTAALIAARHPGVPVRYSTLIDEVLSPHQGRPIAELDAEGWRLYEAVPPGYETPDDVLARARRLLDRLRREYDGHEVAVVSHGDVVLALHCWVQGRPFNDETKKEAVYPATASVTTLGFLNGETAPRMFRYHRPY